MLECQYAQSAIDLFLYAWFGWYWLNMVEFKADLINFWKARGLTSLRPPLLSPYPSPASSATRSPQTAPQIMPNALGCASPGLPSRWISTLSHPNLTPSPPPIPSIGRSRHSTPLSTIIQLLPCLQWSCWILIWVPVRSWLALWPGSPFWATGWCC